jgi:hypothetical protein
MNFDTQQKRPETISVKMLKCSNDGSGIWKSFGASYSSDLFPLQPGNIVFNTNPAILAFRQQHLL